ncbi:MAG: hypothetical protein IJU37_09245 [Desulfovibrio sp.]|nr:hypothetical protein [Desulfovibrio sp.]
MRPWKRQRSIARQKNNTAKGSILSSYWPLLIPLLVMEKCPWAERFIGILSETLEHM